MCIYIYVCVCVCVCNTHVLHIYSISGQCKSVQVDVTGRLRRTKVRLPSSILGSKPYSVPNEQVAKQSHGTIVLLYIIAFKNSANNKDCS